MGVIFDEPKYPVIDPAPGFWKIGDLLTAELSRAKSVLSAYGADGMQNICIIQSDLLCFLKLRNLSLCPGAVSNFSLRDCGIFAGVTALCGPYGYFVGEWHQLTCVKIAEVQPFEQLCVPEVNAALIHILCLIL